MMNDPNNLNPAGLFPAADEKSAAGLRRPVIPKLITYPARPIQGGRLELAPPKRGIWYVEPKLNGWRTIVHTPTGTMWNRHGSLLTIADCFRPALAALAKLAKLANRGLVWADCEALERRHNLGRGTLVVLDVVPESGTPNYEQRRAMLESLIPTDAVFGGDTWRGVPCGSVILTPSLPVDSHADALAFYERLRCANRTLGCEFFEGVVMKRAASVYPVQIRGATEEFRGWVKHRFLT
jgi:ATP-dependent DNA ligase